MNLNCWLNKGEQIQTNYLSTHIVGDRNIIAGLDYVLIGMQQHGIRKVKISPHLAYRDKGTDSIPPNATLIYEVEIRKIII